MTSPLPTDQLNGASNVEVSSSPELAVALAKNSKARKLFEQLDKTNRYGFYWRVQTANRAETKQARGQIWRDARAWR